MPGTGWPPRRGPGRGSAVVLAAILAVTAVPAAPELRTARAEQVLEEVRRPGAGVVVLNVWATWCQPCREEFPDLLRLRREYGARGLRLVLVSGDFSDQRRAAGRFLAEQGVDFPTFFKEGKDMEFIDGLSPRWSGALPATFVYDGRGELRGFWEGKASYAKLEREVLDVLGSGTAGSETREEGR